MGPKERPKRIQKSEKGEKRLCSCSKCVPWFKRVHRTNVLKHFLENGVYKGPQHQPSNDAWPVPQPDDPDFMAYLTHGMSFGASTLLLHGCFSSILKVLQSCGLSYLLLQWLN